jgi:ribosome maturation factor RimP
VGGGDAREQRRVCTELGGECERSEIARAGEKRMSETAHDGDGGPAGRGRMQRLEMRCVDGPLNLQRGPVVCRRLCDLGVVCGEQRLLSAARGVQGGGVRNWRGRECDVGGVPAATRERQRCQTKQRSSRKDGAGLHCPESAISPSLLDYRDPMTALSPTQLRGLVEPVVATAGYDLEELTVSPAGRRSVVRVVVDRDGGVDLDAVAEVSRAVSAALDESNSVGERPYVLEVTSPGVDRPLTEPRHWRRNLGRMVTVGDLTGRVREVTDDGVIIEVTGSVEHIAFTELGAGRVVLEFTRPEDTSS